MSQERIVESLHRASPLGRLEAHEKILADIAPVIGDEFDLTPYRSAVARARAMQDRGQLLELRVCIEKADHELTLILWWRDPATVTGERQRNHLEDLRNRQNDAKRREADHRREIVLKIASASKLTGGAMEAHVKRTLERDHGIIVSQRTVRRDLRGH